MKRILTITAFWVATTLASTAIAGQQADAVAGAVVGGGAGALIGHSVNGRDGALIGGAIGAIAGVAMASSGRDRERVETRTLLYPPVVHEHVVVRAMPPRVVVHHHEPRPIVLVQRKPGRGHGYDKRHGKDWTRDYVWKEKDRGRDREDDRGGHGRWH